VPDGRVLIDAFQVLCDSEYHAEWGEQKIADYIIGPWLNDRLHVVYVEGQPECMITWTYLPPDRERKYIDNPSSLNALDFEYQYGRLWVIDYAAPYGSCKQCAKEIRKMARSWWGRGVKARIFRTEQNRLGWMVT